MYLQDENVHNYGMIHCSYPPMDDDASPEVLETIEAAANIYVDDTITPDGCKLIVGQGNPPTPPFSQADLNIL